ncbi:flagellar export protein FliJ [Thiomicrorhabdus indica]|uniref:flagellar export protein FliJ n=1 Tax=Thiomicrorhabdus indica TaxID=2267253 RepID=UPI00102E0BA4|nr:flagellar export protein FliJ [Thiomicrorhabdus indica]
MDKQLKTWQKLVELAEMEMDKAGKTLAMMQQKQNQDIEQLESLREYAQDYNKQGINPAQSLSQLNTYRLFADKLMQAIESQETVVTQSETMAEKAREAWLEKRARFKALEKLFIKMQSDYDGHLNKQEQKMLDELAAQQSVQSSQ